VRRALFTPTEGFFEACLPQIVGDADAFVARGLMTDKNRCDLLQFLGYSLRTVNIGQQVVEHQWIRDRDFANGLWKRGGVSTCSTTPNASTEPSTNTPQREGI
jgi:hypothetical protein